MNATQRYCVFKASIPLLDSHTHKSTLFNNYDNSTTLPFCCQPGHPYQINPCANRRGTTMNNHQAKATRKSTHHSRSHHRQHRQTCFTGNGQKINLPPPSELLRAFPGSREMSFVIKMCTRRFLLFNCWTKPRFCRMLLVETMNGPFLLIYQREKTNNKNKRRRGYSFNLLNAQSVRIIRGKMISNVISSEQSHCLVEIQFKFAIVLIDLDGEERIAKWSSIFLKAFEPKLMPPPKPLPRIWSATSLKSSPQEKEEAAKEVPLPQINISIISPSPSTTTIWHMQLASHRDQEEEHAEEEKEDEDQPKKNVENSLEEDLGSSQPNEDSLIMLFVDVAIIYICLLILICMLL